MQFHDRNDYRNFILIFLSAYRLYFVKDYF